MSPEAAGQYPKWKEREGELQAAIEDAGFRLVGKIEQRYEFLYATAIKE